MPGNRDLLPNYIEMEAVLDSCEQELDDSQIGPWLNDYLRRRHRYDPKRRTAALWTRLAQSRDIVRGRVRPAEGSVPEQLIPLMSHTLRLGHGSAVADWNACLADRALEVRSDDLLTIETDLATALTRLND